MQRTTGRQSLARRLGWYLFTTVSAVSLVLCILFVALWGRQRFESDEWQRMRSGSPPTPTANGVMHEWTLFSGVDGLRLEIIARLYPYEPDTMSQSGWWSTGWSQDTRKYAAGPPHAWYGWSTSHSPEMKTHPYVPAILQRWGFVYSTSVRNARLQPGRAITFGVPTWLPCILFAGPPLLWEIRYRQGLGRRRRKGQGLCPTCGYDLRATPGRCPECGAEATPSTAI